MEGFTYSVDSGKAYIAMSTIQGSMEDKADKGQATDSKDAGAGNHVKLAYNRCGCVYEMAMSSSYQATTMQSLLCGKKGDGTDTSNKCNTNFISNPDSVASVHGHAALPIGEDTGNHLNNIMWKYDLDTGKLEERTAATLAGAEVCSPYFYPDVAGFSYLTMVVQHPGSGYTKAGGAAGVGYAAWARQCGASYPACAMPGDDSAARCKAVEASSTFQARLIAAALVAVVFWGAAL